jgi:hypothetical protein
METMNENARLALCRLVLYSECDADSKDNKRNNLQDEGSLDRSRLLEFIGLCQTAVKLECVKKHLEDGSKLFDDLPSPPEEELTAMKFPQTRLEKVQRLISKAVGWDPDFTTQEIRRIFFEPNSTEYSNDKEIMLLFQQLVAQMNTAVTYASLKATEQQFSDMDQGGVTRVVSVNYSEVTLNQDHLGEGGTGRNVNAPRKESIDPSLTEEEQKRQIRLASEAARLQQELLEKLMNMPGNERNLKLEEAKSASDDFLKQVMALPAGRERITFLQSVDPHTQQLLAMHKLWTGMLAANGGKTPNMAKKL